MITTQGLNIIAQSIADKFTMGEVGTDNSAPQDTDTDLVAPLSSTQKAFSEKTVSSNLISLVYELTVSEGNGQNIKEFGTFINDGTDEKLISRFVHSSINKSDQIALVYRVEYLVEKK